MIFSDKNINAQFLIGFLVLIVCDGTDNISYMPHHFFQVRPAGMADREPVLLCILTIVIQVCRMKERLARDAS